MPTNKKPRKHFTATVRPTKQFLPSHSPVLIYTPTSESARSKICSTQIKCKVSEGDQLLFKRASDQTWNKLDTSRPGHLDILEQVLVSLMKVDGVIFDYGTAAREEVPVTDGPVSGGTDVRSET